MSVKIALAGNPNCGKTTLFNALTGSNQFVGNWPGVTIDKKEGFLDVFIQFIKFGLVGVSNTIVSGVIYFLLNTVCLLYTSPSPRD